MVPDLPYQMSQISKVTFSNTRTKDRTPYIFCAIHKLALFRIVLEYKATQFRKTAGMAELYPDLRDRPIKETVCLFDVMARQDSQFQRRC